MEDGRARDARARDARVPGSARRASGPRSPGSEGGDGGTRRRLIDAAIQTILEQGFYRASSNAIAERAGLSWGVIQYYFGSREALMLAVHEEGSLRLIEELRRADLTGETLVERLEQYFNILEGYYGSADYLAFVQVMLNLSHDPQTSEQARATVESNTQAIGKELRRLTSRLLEGMDVTAKPLREFPFHVLRGLALSEAMVTTFPERYFPRSGGQDGRADDSMAQNRRLLARALALLFAEEAAKA